MHIRAICSLGLCTAALAPAQEAPGVWIEASATSLITSTNTHRAPVARWDGTVVDAEESVHGLEPSARSSMETWRTFAERRGYRIDLDPSQRVMVVSDADRFENFATSSAIVERVLDELEPFMGASGSPLVLFRASSTNDASTVQSAARALEIDTRLGMFVETGGLSDRRSVDARLAEQLTRTALNIEAPYLSEWMADGVASFVAEAATGRAMIDGKAVTLRSVQGDVVREHKKDENSRIDLLSISGTRGSIGKRYGPVPMEAEALAVIACIDEHYPDALAQIVNELGTNQPEAQTAKYKQEEESLQRYLGLTALLELQRALENGRRFRRR